MVVQGRQLSDKVLAAVEPDISSFLEQLQRLVRHGQYDYQEFVSGDLPDVQLANSIPKCLEACAIRPDLITGILEHDGTARLGH